MLRFIRWRSLFGRRKFEKEMADEFAFHVEARTRDLIANGVDEMEAERRARLEFGAMPRYSDECRGSHRLNWADDAIRDLRYAVRMLRRNRGFTATALVSLALGIGLNVAVFSVFQSLLLRPLPVERPGELAFVESNTGISHSFPAYRDYRDRTRAFAGLAGYRITPMSVETGGNPERLWGYLVTGNYFDVLGIQPAVGRFFHQEDDRQAGASPYAVISYSTWRTRFAGDPSIPGRRIRINGLSYTVLGVAPREFHGTEVFYWPEVYVPMMMEAQIEPGNSWLENRHTWNTWIVGRLKSGVTRAQAAADLSGITTEMARHFPDLYDGIRIKLSDPGLAGSFMRQPVGLFVKGLLLLVSLVLLAACVNIASLMLARATDRRREVAIRTSVGASRSRLVRQILTEALLIACAGGVLGWGVAIAVCTVASRWHAPVDFPVQLDVRPDASLLLVVAGLSVAAGLLFGLAPALQVSGADVSGLMKADSGRRVGRTRFRVALRDVLVTAEIAICLVLVFACFSSLRGLRKALTIPLGFKPEGVATVAFDLAQAGYTQPQGRVFQKHVLEAVRQLPDIGAAAYANSLPLSIDQSNTAVRGEGKAVGRKDIVSANYYQVSPGFLSAMSVSLLAGRDFNWHDDEHAPLVAIVNETFAKRVMNTAQPVGKAFRWGFGGTRVQVIGLVADGKYGSLTESPMPVVFWPAAQNYNPTTTLVIRSSESAGRVIENIRRIVHTLDSRMPIYGAGSMTSMLGFALFPMRAAAVALSTFGVIALVLAMTGIHGLVAYAIARRKHEIGIRIAIGATAGHVLRAVLTRLCILAATGSILGILLSVLARGLLRSVVLGMSTTDAGLMIAVTLCIGFAAALSCMRPALAAIRTDPVVALRCE